MHAAAISFNPGSRLVAFSDDISENAQKLATHYSGTARTTDEIIADKGIDTALIATSTDTHSDLIEPAVTAGKAVLCEMPVDLSLACQKAISGSGRPVTIGFNRRFAPNFSS